ncbi:5-formyltetrahydrofolate cyclo-ligase [Chitiniphilus purpureus]|uniref:5-formyltetrahydrofolate cyclo-ligase n=1 Tax=Chitiniphilus purpureus TaxID=2981137 RepID=A0ABY6DN12_9NEIS|nr:5-formyltetrahydrofolate cyclo-ligase [Chitiniphilus sp. CD1]UXY15755.1 5-formyltetrahydrofolate cyclo-ligase [Chitiniphilus sp. CD1]
MFPSPNPPQDKLALRRMIRARRAALGAAVRHEASVAVARHALALGLFRAGRRLAAYVPTGSELSTWPLILQALRRRCALYLPHVPRRGRKMDFVRLDAASEWRAGQFGILEPHHHEVVAARSLDVVFVPLLAFDVALARLGQGGGYYDTTFHFRRIRRRWRKPLLVGLAFDEQRVCHVPAERWDLHLDLVITPAGILRAQSPPVLP